MFDNMTPEGWFTLAVFVVGFAVMIGLPLYMAWDSDVSRHGRKMRGGR